VHATRAASYITASTVPVSQISQWSVTPRPTILRGQRFLEVRENIYFDDEPRNLGKLQLVRRTWTAVVNESPSLAFIALAGPFRDDIAQYKQYINKCVGKSVNLPIHVTFKVRRSSTWPLLARHSKGAPSLPFYRPNRNQPA
jgi:hypothetical protein